MFSPQFKKFFPIIFPILFLLSIILPAAALAQTNSEQIVELPGSVSEDLGDFQDNPQTPTPPGETKAVSLVLKPRNEAVFEASAREVNDPISPRYHKLLTETEIQKNFSPDLLEFNDLKNHFKNQGLSINYESSDRFVLSLAGSSSKLDQAFNTTTQTRVKKNGEKGRINVTPFKLPAFQASKIKAVIGFDELHLPQTHSAKTPPQPKPNANAFGINSGKNSPAGLRTAYNIGSTGLDGGGTRVAITLWTPPNKTDLANWTNYYGFPLNLNIIQLGINPTNTGVFEANLDVEMVQTAAPNAEIRFYVSQIQSYAALMVAIQTAITDNVNAISNSWGGCEATISRSTLNGFHTQFQTASLKGIPVFFSSGDSGIFSCPGNSIDPSNWGKASFPAVDDLVTAVGGTTLSLNPADSSYAGETGWSCAVTDGSIDASCLQSGKGSSGGGVSINVARPGYQAGIVPPVIASINQNTFPSSKRLIPDISTNGDPVSGVPIFVNGCLNTITNPCFLGGGTSASAPLMTGITALAAQKNIATIGPNAQVGGLNTFIYQNSNSALWLTDVNSGYNGGGSNAIQNWDYLTGVGSIKNANNFITALLGMVIPVSNLNDSGPGSLREALNSSTLRSQGGKIRIDLKGIITVGPQPLPNLPPGVSLIGSCQNGPGTIIKAGQGLPFKTIGLNLEGNDSLFGIEIKGFQAFGGSDLLANTRGNRLSCIKTT